MCFVWISEPTAIISLYCISWLVFITETESVYCAVRAECACLIHLNIMKINPPCLDVRFPNYALQHQSFMKIPRPVFWSHCCLHSSVFIFTFIFIRILSERREGEAWESAYNMMLFLPHPPSKLKCPSFLPFLLLSYIFLLCYVSLQPTLTLHFVPYCICCTPSAPSSSLLLEGRADTAWKPSEH